MIRSAGADDVNAVLELWRTARSPAALTPDTEQAVATLIAHEGSVLWWQSRITTSSGR